MIKHTHTSTSPRTMIQSRPHRSLTHFLGSNSRFGFFKCVCVCECLFVCLLLLLSVQYFKNKCTNSALLISSRLQVSPSFFALCKKMWEIAIELQGQSCKEYRYWLCLKVELYETHQNNSLGPGVVQQSRVPMLAELSEKRNEVPDIQCKIQAVSGPKARELCHYKIYHAANIYIYIYIFNY